MLSYLVGKASQALEPNVIIPGAQVVLAGAVETAQFTGFPPPDEFAAYVWVEFFNDSGPTGPTVYISTDQAPPGPGIPKGGLALPTGEKVRVKNPQLANTTQAINGQPWPFGGDGQPVISNLTALPARIQIAWGCVK